MPETVVAQAQGPTLTPQQAGAAVGSAAGIPAAGAVLGVAGNPTGNLPAWTGQPYAQSMGMAGSPERGPQGSTEANIHGGYDPVALDQAGFIATARATNAFPDLSDDGILEWVKKFSAQHTMTFQDIYHYGKEAMTIGPSLGLTGRQALELYAALVGKTFVIQGGSGTAMGLMKNLRDVVVQMKIPMIGQAIYSAIVFGDTAAIQSAINAISLKALTNPEARQQAANLATLVTFCISPTPEMMAKLHDIAQRKIYREQQRWILFRSVSRSMMEFFANIDDKVIKSIKEFQKDPSALLKIKGIPFDWWVGAIADIGKAYNTGAEIALGAFGITPSTGISGPGGKPPEAGLVPTGSTNNKQIRTAEDPIPSTVQPGAMAGSIRSMGTKYQISGLDAAIQSRINDDITQGINALEFVQSILDTSYKNIYERKEMLEKSINIASATSAENTPAGGKQPISGDIFRLTEGGATMASSIEEVQQLITEIATLLTQYEQNLGIYDKYVVNLVNIYKTSAMKVRQQRTVTPDVVALFERDISANINALQVDLQRRRMTGATLWTYVKVVRQIVPDQWKASLMEQQFVALFTQYSEQAQMDYPGIRLMTGGINNNLRIMAAQLSAIYGKIARTLSSPQFATQAQVGQEKTGGSVSINVLRYNYMRRSMSWWSMVLKLQNFMLGKGTLADTIRTKKLYREAKRIHKIVVKKKEDKDIKDDFDKDAITEDTQERYQEYYGTKDQPGELPYGSKDESTNEWVQTLTHDPTPQIVQKKMRAKIP